MNSFTALEQYLNRVKTRLRVAATTRGLGIAAAAALLLTLLCVVFANRFAFAGWSVISGRAVLFSAVGAILLVLLVRPLLAMRRHGSSAPWVKRMEERFPAFGERIQTFVDRKRPDRPNPILDLLAEDTLRLAAQAPPEEIAASGPIWTFTGVALAAIAVLIWLGAAGPGYFGYGTARLWAGWLRPHVSNLYQILVQPGSTTIRRKAELLISAKTIGFYSPDARLFAKYASSAKWEEVPMQRRLDDTGFEFLFAGVEEPLHYYVAAGGVKSPEYEVRVVEMPSVKKLRLTYHYPSWTGMADSTQEPGGDIRAVAGTDVDVEVETDRPLPSGVLRIDATSVPLRGEQNWSRGKVTVQKDGRYFVAAVYNGETVRLSDDFFIEAVPDHPPAVRVARPGRDATATPIEEVTAQLEGEDDFGLKGFELRYSVNGGPEKAVRLPASGQKSAAASYTFAIENLSLVPGDVISYYAAAKDAKVETKTDMYFIEVQPFEREFYQSQMMGGGGAGGGEDETSQISRRQKEIVNATWNLARERKLDKQKAADDAKTLSGIQSKLRDQAQTLAERMKRRQLAGANPEFKAFAENMERAAGAMQPASEQLSAQKWEGALPPEQKALQHLLRAEAIFRQIQVAFGNQGGGGGGMGRDLAEMFHLELDIEKNQYETGQQSAQDREQEMDQALEKLRELARRQEQLAEEQKRQQTPSFDQRWQQEMLRREAEELARQLRQMQQQQGGQQSSRGQQQSAQAGNSSNSGNQTLQRALERLQQAARDMEASAGQGRASGAQEQRAAGQRAQERLKEAEEMLAADRRRRAGEDLDDLERRATELASRQEASAGKLREALRQSMEGRSRDPLTGRLQMSVAGGLTREQAQALAREKDQMQAQVADLEKKMQETARRLAGTQPDASHHLRETLGNMQQQELPTKLKLSAEYLKRGMGLYVPQYDQRVTEGLNQVRQGIQETRRLAQAGQQGRQQGLEQALNRVEQLRQQLEQALAAERARQQGQRAGEQQGQRQAGQGEAGQQAGGQPGPGQQSGEARGGTYNGGAHLGWAGGPWNRGYGLPPGRLPDPADPSKILREGPIQLSEIERTLRNDPDLARDIEDLRRQLRGLDSRFPSNPELLAQREQKLLQEAEQLELLLRRKLDEKQGAQVRSANEQPVPEPYRKAVAEYFRRLSKQK
jgi:hypothetical protein